MKIIGKSIEFSKHIAIITPGFAENESDTVCIPALQLLVKELIKTGLKITIFALHYPFSKQSYQWFGAEVIPMNGKNNALVRRTILFPRLRKAFQYKNEQCKIDIIHSFWLNETTFWSEKLSREFQIPVVATAQGQDVLASNRFLKKINWDRINLFCISEYQKIELKKSVSDEIGVIPMGIEKETIDSKTFDIIGVGNLIPLKNFSYFIEICKELKQVKPAFSAKLIGIGTEYDILRKQVSEFGLSNNVEFLGQLSYEETQKKIAQAKVLLHTSAFEGFGMVLIEALANGTHVLSTPVGIAYQEEKIEKLTLNVQQDVQTLRSLLAKDTFPSIKYSIQQTVATYLKMFGELL